MSKPIPDPEALALFGGYFFRLRKDKGLEGKALINRFEGLTWQSEISLFEHGKKLLLYPVMKELFNRTGVQITFRHSLRAIYVIRAGMCLLCIPIVPPCDWDDIRKYADLCSRLTELTYGKLAEKFYYSENGFRSNLCTSPRRHPPRDFCERLKEFAERHPGFVNDAHLASLPLGLLQKNLVRSP